MMHTGQDTTMGGARECARAAMIPEWGGGSTTKPRTTTGGHRDSTPGSGANSGRVLRTATGMAIVKPSIAVAALGIRIPSKNEIHETHEILNASFVRFVSFVVLLHA